MAEYLNRITIAILPAADGQHPVWINDELSYHITEAEVAALLTETRKNLWRTDTSAGAALGRRLYDLLNRGSGALQGIIANARATGAHTHLYVQTPYELTQLPFELLHNGSFVLLAHNIHVIRLVDDRGRLATVAPKKEALRMLFMACSPTDGSLNVLGFEKEEERIFETTSPYNIDMRIEDTGSLEGLRQANIAGGGFDIIHITGHAGLDDDLGPVFCMEDEVGQLKLVSPEMLWDALRDFPPKLLFLSGCSTGSADERANSESFAYKMAQKGIQWVLGWGLPVSDTGATLAATEIYRCLSIGTGIDHAVASACRLPKIQYHPWPLLRLFGDATPIVPLVEPGLPIKKSNPVKLRHKYLKDSNVRVLDSGFVGRRRSVQRGVSVLSGRADKYGLLVRGPAGIGKSCLVGKLVDRFAHGQDKKELVVFHGVITEADVLVKLRGLLDKIRNRRALEIMKSDIPYEDKIKDLFSFVFKKDIPTIIYFDDFEQNLYCHGNKHYLKSEAIEIIRPFLEAVDWAEGISNVVISSRYPFILEHGGENLPAMKLFDIALMSFYGADLGKKTRELEFIAQSKHAALYLEYGGGNPRLLEWFNVIAKDEKKYNLDDLEAKLRERKGEFIHDYLADVIAKTEGDEFHKFIQRAAVYREPVGATAFEGFGGEQFLDTAVDLTLVEREGLSRGEFVYWVTPVIRDAMWGKLTAAEMLEMHGRAYRWYDRWIATSTEPNYKYMEEAVRHALEVGNIRGACPHACVLGRYFDRMVLYRQGLAIMETVAVRVSDTVVDEAKATKDANVAAFLHEYAYSLDTLGDPKQAIAFYEKALASRLEVYGERHPDVATSYNNIGSAWGTLGDSKQAIAFYEKSLSIKLEVYGERHPDVATSYNNIGSAWGTLGDSKQAIAFYEKSLSIKLEVYGERHPSVATSYNNIGSAWDTLGDSKQAIAFYEKALAIRLEVYGERHPDVAISYNNIGSAWGTLGDSKQAIAFYEKSIVIRLEVYGERHPDVAISYNNIGSALYTLGDPKQAIAFFEKALNIWMEVYGERHPNIAQVCKNLADVFAKSGDPHKAAEYTAKAALAWS
ncbi:MAG: tetratricopeptide repeat protein [Nitrospirae bacterium]|nr:tetratricopeptide repeat protein [Nitrospirota bacterium]